MCFREHTIRKRTHTKDNRNNRFFCLILQSTKHDTMLYKPISYNLSTKCHLRIIYLMPFVSFHFSVNKIMAKKNKQSQHFLTSKLYSPIIFVLNNLICHFLLEIYIIFCSITSLQQQRDISYCLKRNKTSTVCEKKKTVLMLTDKMIIIVTTNFLAVIRTTLTNKQTKKDAYPSSKKLKLSIHFAKYLFQQFCGMCCFLN